MCFGAFLEDPLTPTEPGWRTWINLEKNQNFENMMNFSYRRKTWPGSLFLFSWYSSGPKTIVKQLLYLPIMLSDPFFNTKIYRLYLKIRQQLYFIK